MAGESSVRKEPSADTSARAAEIQIDLWRRMSAAEKARIVAGLTRAVQELCLAGIRERHPLASERECLLRLAVVKLGPELACKVYPEISGWLVVEP